MVVTPYGRPASLALAQAIGLAKKGDPLAPVTVIVPSNFAGLTARRMLGSGLLGVDGVANVNFFTPFRFAELLAVGRLTGQRPLTNPVLGAAVRRALADDPQHFRAVRDHQATEQALASAVGELSNVSAAGLAAIETDGEHAAGVIRLYRAIVGYLTGFHDEAAVARAAGHRRDLARVMEPFGHVVWYLPGQMSAPLAGFVGVTLVARPSSVIVGTSGSRPADREVERSLRIAGITADLGGGGGVAAPPVGAEAPSLGEPPLAEHIISVTDADEEVRAVIREVIQLVSQGVALDRIGIFHPVPDPYVRIIEQQFGAAAIPVNGPSRRRLADSIAGRVLVAALALPSERWRRDRVLALVNSGPVRHDGATVRPSAWERLSREAAVIGGLTDWRAKLGRHLELLATWSAEAEAAGRAGLAQNLARERSDVEALLSFVESLAEQVAQVDAASGWQGRAVAATTLLKSLVGGAHTHTTWPESEQVAYESVEAALERLAMLDEIEPNPSAAVFVRALSAELSVARGRSGRFGHGVVYGPLASAPGHDLDAVFVLGCIEGLCPAPRREDVLLPDRARALTNGDLPQRLNQLDEQHRLFLAALAAAPEHRRWLFLPRGDLRSSRRSRPSRWLLPTAGKLAGKRLYATDFEHENPLGVHVVASHARALLDATHFTSVDERDLAEVYAYVDSGGDAAGHPAAQPVVRGLYAQRARAGRAFTEFDGNLAGVRLPSTDVRPQSSSRLESWAACGFRYFLSSVLGLGERDDPERTTELSALDRGSAMHSVLERFMREVVEAGAPQPDERWTQAHRARAHEIAAEVFDEYERRGRTGRHIVWETQKADLRALIDEFLTADDRFRAEAGATPEHLELAFGMGDRAPVSVALDNGRTLRFRGTIDRVDTAAGGVMHVSDYKTGSGSKYGKLEDAVDPTRGGKLLQLGLYAEAVAQHLSATRVDTRYWMINTAADYARIGYRWTPDRRDRLIEVLTAMVDGIENGVFPANPGEWESYRNTHAECAYCEFDRLCLRDRAEHADQKADAPELAVRVALMPRSDREPAAPT